MLRVSTLRFEGSSSLPITFYLKLFGHGLRNSAHSISNVPNHGSAKDKLRLRTFRVKISKAKFLVIKSWSSEVQSGFFLFLFSLF